jgi:hypothetical protein
MALAGRIIFFREVELFSTFKNVLTVVDQFVVVERHHTLFPIAECFHSKAVGGEVYGLQIVHGVATRSAS